MRPPSEWELLGRPAGEWLYLPLLAALGLNAFASAAGQEFHGAAQATVLAAEYLSGVAALGTVAATLVGWRVGFACLWGYAVSAVYTAAMSNATFGGQSVLDVVWTAFAAALLCSAVVWYGSRRLHASITRRQWPALLREHASATDEFVATIGGLSDTQWTSRTDPAMWSPAEITEHLARTYSQYAGESRGKNSLRIRIGPVRRTLARLFVKPRLLNGAPFPKARAPRELRPSGGPASPADGVALFRATGESCLRDLGVLVERRPHRRLVHPYLGALPLYDIVRFATQHIRHHRRQLLTVLASSPSEE